MPMLEKKKREHKGGGTCRLAIGVVARFVVVF